MPLVFSYGTLQEEHVQLSTFGRLLDGQRDELLAFEPSLVRIEDPQVVATWANHKSKKDQGVLLCPTDRLVTANTVKEAFWNELISEGRWSGN